MKQKKLLLLGGLRYLLPVIEAAHKLGYYVITCDYIPGNIAHKYSDEYHNVSIIDKEAVLALARELEIDGIDNTLHFFGIRHKSRCIHFLRMFFQRAHIFTGCVHCQYHSKSGNIYQ